MTSLAALIRSFFEQYLLAQRGLSGHTVLAYRDTLKLWLEFVCREHRKSCTDLSLEDLTAKGVRAFLDHLERVRNNSVPTRNARLAAIHCFFQYLASIDPRYMEQALSVRAVGFKRQSYPVPQYLERDEVLRVFSNIPGHTIRDQRDDALLRCLYNTGMRAQEAVDLNVTHVRFQRPYHVRIQGKGRKERTCPLWADTVAALKSYLGKRGVRLDEPVPLFTGVRGDRLTRFGIRYIVAHRVSEAAKTCPSLLARRVTPHTLRHTTAMHLLQSRVDLSMIRSWLGHASIETTSRYVEIDLEMKRKTLRATEKLLPKSNNPRAAWTENKDLIAWLSSL